MSASEFPGPGLTVEQWGHIRALAASLTPQQTMWVSGYFAGFDDAQRGGVGLAEGPAGPVAAPAAAQAGVRTLTILYGSETGNSAALAKALAEQCHAVGRSPVVCDMGDYKLRHLKEEQDLVLISATHGEGDPPQAAADFFEYVEGRKAPKLAGVRYAVLALGDSTYEKYCEAGKRLDRRFEELGAVRLQPRADCDVDYEEPAAAWSAALLEDLRPEPGAQQGAAAPAHTQSSLSLVARAAGAFDKRNPFPATLIDNLVLTGRGSTKETRHVELSLEGSGLTFEPGDSLGIIAENDPAVVERLASELGFNAEQSVALKSGDTTLADALARNFEITIATPRFIEHWAKLSGAEALQALTRPEAHDERNAYLHGHHVIDIVRAHPVPGVDPQAFLAGLRPMQPRLYSIASSPAAAPDEAHLTVSTVRYALHGEPRAGVASCHLAERAPVDCTIPVYVQPNPHFRLPDREAPIVMIGAGTGVAPYRAFLQEREAQGASGRSWLFFGERNFRTDFLYQTEWQGWLKDGVLTRMDVAFSRDETRKVYVQHRMLEHAAEVFAWIEEGARLYVCGDAVSLAPDVHEALLTILEEQGGLSREAAEEYLRELQRERRYQRDVY